MLSRFIRAANATIIGQIIARFGSFILVPMFLSHWSPAVYGEWLTLFAAVGYLSSLDVGMQAAALNRLTAAFARHDISDYRKTQSSALSMYCLTAGCGILLLITVATFMPVGRWLGLKITSRLDSSVAMILLGTYVLWTLPGKIIIGSYQTMGRLSRSQWVSNTQALINLLLMAVLLSLGFGMKSLASLTLITAVAAAVLVVADLRRNHPEIAPALRGADWDVMRALVRPSLMFALITGAMLLHYQGLTLLVSVSLGGTAVAVFSVSRTLAAVLRTATDTIADSIAPDVCRLDALHDGARLGQLLKLLIGLSVCLGVAGAVSIWWEGTSIITVWTRGRLVPNEWLIRLLAAVSIGQSVWVGLSVFGTATNRNKNVALCYLTSNVVAIVVAAVLIQRYGVLAIPVGLLIGETVGCYHFMVRDACTRCSVRYASFAPKLWGFVLATSVAALSVSYVVHAALASTFAVVRWPVVGLASLTLTAASSWFIWFEANQRAMVKTASQRLFKRANTEKGVVPTVAEAASADRA